MPEKYSYYDPTFGYITLDEAKAVKSFNGKNPFKSGGNFCRLRKSRMTLKPLRNVSLNCAVLVLSGLIKPQVRLLPKDSAILC
jgi:hypothetical protein